MTVPDWPYKFLFNFLILFSCWPFRDSLVGQHRKKESKEIDTWPVFWSFGRPGKGTYVSASALILNGPHKKKRDSKDWPIKNVRRR